MFFPWQDPALHAAMLALALLWDALLGEPPNRLHPVAWLGTLIQAARPKTLERPARAFVWGLLVALFLPVAAAALGGILVQTGWWGLPLSVFFCTASFSIRCLGEASEKVSIPLQDGDLPAARAGLGWLCSRDAAELDASQLSAGAIESVAENASDSAVAPLFFFAILGLPGLMAYRVVNTLDAMWGYRDAREWLGKPAARLDDLLNWIPARITAALLLAADPRRAGAGARTAWADASKTDSPNAGWPMAAMAGLLGVTLAKPGHYSLGTGPEPQGRDIAPAWAICQRAMRTAGGLVLLTLAVYQLKAP